MNKLSYFRNFHHLPLQLKQALASVAIMHPQYFMVTGIKGEGRHFANCEQEMIQFYLSIDRMVYVSQNPVDGNIPAQSH